MSQTTNMAPAHCTNPISMTSLPDALTHFNGRRYVSKNGLLDLLTEAMSEEPLYPGQFYDVLVDDSDLYDLYGTVAK